MRPMYESVKVTDLRDGDVIRIGASTNHILACEVVRADGFVDVYAYDGDKPASREFGPSLRFDEGAFASVSRRDCASGKRGSGSACRPAPPPNEPDHA